MATSNIQETIDQLFDHSKTADEATLLEIAQDKGLIKEWLQSLSADLATGFWVAKLYILQTTPIENVFNQVAYMAAIMTLLYNIDYYCRVKSRNKKTDKRNQAIKAIFTGEIQNRQGQGNFVTEEYQLDDALEADVLEPHDRAFLKLFHGIASGFVTIQLFTTIKELASGENTSLIFFASILAYLFTRLLLSNHYAKETAVRKFRVKQIFEGVEQKNEGYAQQRLEITPDENNTHLPQEQLLTKHNQS